jgi:hypothetical protein
MSLADGIEKFDSAKFSVCLNDNGSAFDESFGYADQQLTGQLIRARLPFPPPNSRGPKQPGNAPDFDLRTHLYRITGVDLTQIAGLGALSVLVILSEVGNSSITAGRSQAYFDLQQRKQSKQSALEPLSEPLLV